MGTIGQANRKQQSEAAQAGHPHIDVPAVDNVLKGEDSMCKAPSRFGLGRSYQNTNRALRPFPPQSGWKSTANILDKQML